MAVTENTYTQQSGDPNTRSFTFPYLKESDVKVTVAGTALDNGTASDEWQFANATTVQFNTTPANGSFIRIYRETADTNLSATFYAGSAIKSQDLNDNFTQNLYVTQEVRDDSALALSNSREHDGDGTYTTAIAKSTSAVNTANDAETKSDTAKLATDRLVATTSDNGSTWTLAGNNTNASTDPKGVGYAVTQAEAAVNTANAADTIADNAKLATDRLVATTSNNGATWTLAGNNTNASTDPKGVGYAVTQAEAAVSTANDAETKADSAVSTANSANSTAATANSTANTANTTANTASTNATNAVNTANSASSTATAAQTAVANAVLYTPYANVAAIPGSPSDGDYIEVQNSAGIESFSPLSGLPTGFTGHAELTVKLLYNGASASPANTWVWQQYYATDPESRYRKKLIVENKTTIDENYTIGTNNNAYSVGPVAVAANKTVTIPANSLYFIG